MTRPLDLDPVVTAAIETLASAIGAVPPPCWSDPDAWYDNDPEPAIEACRTRCHARAECHTYADAVGADCGVWAGVERTRTRKRRVAA